ncbi:carbohydrate-binding protein, partial [Streptomyces sp. NPDC026666]
GNASVADCSTCSGGKKVGNLYLGGKLTVNDVVVDKPGTYLVQVAYVSGDARSADISANGGGATGHKFPSTGDWGTTGTVSVPVALKAGANTLTFDSGSSYAPDIDRIDVPKSPR